MKELLKTKTFWTGAASIITGVGLIVGGSQVEGIQTILLGFGMIFTRTAIAKKA